MHLYTNGVWDKSPSVLDKASTAQELYQKLSTLGFQQSQELLYRGGNAQLYMRVSQPGKHLLPIGFEFCCVLYLGKFLYPVGLKSLQDVLHFYQEIDAHPKETEAITTTHLREFQLSLAGGLSDLAERLEDSNVTVKNLSGLKLALDQLNATLSTIGKGFPLRITRTPGKIPFSPTNAGQVRTS